MGLSTGLDELTSRTLFGAVCIHDCLLIVCLTSLPRTLLMGDVNCVCSSLCSLSHLTDVLLTVVFPLSSGTVSLQFLEDYQSCL